jgi:hypothetical protein
MSQPTRRRSSGGASRLSYRWAVCCPRSTAPSDQQFGYSPLVGRRGSKMRATRSKSNQDSGALGKVVSEIMAALAAPEAKSGLSRLAKRLAGLRASDAQPRAITRRRLGPRRRGWVLVFVWVARGRYVLANTAYVGLARTRSACGDGPRASSSFARGWAVRSIAR